MLRALARELGLAELSKRAGVRVTAAMVRSGKAPGRVRQAIQKVEARRESAKKAARAKEKRKTRILEDVKPGELARAAGVTERTARKWIEEGGAPKHAHDVAIALAMGEEPYPEPKAGRGKASRDRLAPVGKAMADFVGAVRRAEDGIVIQKFYRKWRKAKDSIRSKISRRRWAAFIERMGNELDLPEVGVFSKERFRKS